MPERAGSITRRSTSAEQILGLRGATLPALPLPAPQTHRSSARHAMHTAFDPEFRQQRDLRAIVADGVSFSVMVGLGETYLAAFVLAAGLGDVAAGLVTTIPLLAGAILQLTTPAGVRVLRSHRRWVVLCALLQAASFIPLIAGAVSGRVSLALVFCVAAAYWGFGMATSPAWNTWVGSLVPAHTRALFFARRTRWAQAALFAALLSAGAWLDRTHDPDGSLAPFAWLFALAALARLVSAGFLASQSETLPLPEDHRSVSIVAFLGRLRRRGEGTLLAHLLAVQLAVYVAAPFFVPYMLSTLALSYRVYTLLIAAAFAGRVLALPALGRIAQRYGARRLLVLSACGITPLPALWLMSSEPLYLGALQVGSGVAWAGFELATLMLFFEHIDARERTGVLTCFNLANAVALAAGSLIGAALFQSSGGGMTSYVVVLLVSSCARVLTLPLLRGIPAQVGGAAAVPLRTLAVRPSSGALQRPIVSAVSDRDDEA
jgi:MFS family permease